MNERIFDMARQKGATDEQGNRAGKCILLH